MNDDIFRGLGLTAQKHLVSVPERILSAVIGCVGKWTPVNPALLATGPLCV